MLFFLLLFYNWVTALLGCLCVFLSSRESLMFFFLFYFFSSNLCLLSARRYFISLNACLASSSDNLPHPVSQTDSFCFVQSDVRVSMWKHLDRWSYCFYGLSLVYFFIIISPSLCNSCICTYWHPCRPISQSDFKIGLKRGTGTLLNICVKRFFPLSYFRDR